MKKIHTHFFIWSFMAVIMITHIIIPGQLERNYWINDYELICMEYEKIPKAMIKTTCDVPVVCYKTPCTKYNVTYISDKEEFCDGGKTIKVEPIIANIEGECIWYGLIKK